MSFSKQRYILFHSILNSFFCDFSLCGCCVWIIMLWWQENPLSSKGKKHTHWRSQFKSENRKKPLGASFSWSVFCLKIPFKTNTHNSVYNTLFRPSPIRYVPLLSQRNLLVFLQHTDTHSVYCSLPFCKPESSLLSSCPWLN